ncbi:energy-coupling factor transporter transmembrane component T family protein [[Eubacterium] cellulosolvens]
MPEIEKSFFLYSPKTSFIHKLNPLTKIFLIFTISIAVFYATEFYSGLLLLCISFSLILLAKIPLNLMKKFTMTVIGMLQFIMLSWIFLNPMEGNITFYEQNFKIFSIHGREISWYLSISDLNLIHAINMDVRLLTMFFATILFITTTKDRDIVYGLRKLRIPFAACLMISLMFRAISIFMDDFNIVREAMMSKGTDFSKGNISERIRRYVYLIIPLIILMIKRTEEIAYAIEARGIPLRSKIRSLYYEFRLKTIDYVFFTLFIALLFMILYLNRILMFISSTY